MSDTDALPPSSPGAPPPLVVTKSADFRVVYSNVFQYRLAISDVTVVFGLLSDSGDPPAAFQQTQEVAVVMNYGQLKNLAEYLTMIVARYEREIGPVLGVGKEPPQESELNSLFTVLKSIGTHR
jgi:hypothetical protein